MIDNPETQPIDRQSRNTANIGHNAQKEDKQ